MYAAVLSLSLCSVLVVVPDRPAPDVKKPLDVEQEKKPLDVEQEWYDQLQRNGTLTIDLKPGRVILTCQKFNGRKLLNPRLIRFDEMNELVYISSANEGELRFYAADRMVLLDLREWNVECPNGTQIYVENRVQAFELPVAK